MRDRKDSACFLIFDGQRVSFEWYRVPYKGRLSLEAIRNLGTSAPPGGDCSPVIGRVLRAVGKWKDISLERTGAVPPPLSP